MGSSYRFSSGRKYYSGDKAKLQHKEIGKVKMYYTLDGSIPTEESALYNPSTYQPELNKPIVINREIDADKNEIIGIKVMQQDETPGWGEWLAETWFTDRFKGKSVNKYLERAILEAKEDNEIIQITSATVSTQAVLNGVNSAMGLYREVVMGEEADPVPLKVEEFITESE